MKSPKEIALEQKLLSLAQGMDSLSKLLVSLFEDKEIQELQEYCNTVSIKRLGFNDHGPVHMRQVVYNALKMLLLLKEAGVKTSLEAEENMSFEESAIAVTLGAFLHDLGMSVTREQHELLSLVLGEKYIDRYLTLLYPDNIKTRIVLRSMAVECIFGHMATRKVFSVEAGLILIADGCDMAKGRARIPLQLNSKPDVGDIHRYSADSIQKVTIQKGEEKPIQINIYMDSYAGLFQVEEVLLGKVSMSSDKNYIELFAYVNDEVKKYL